MLNYIPEQSPFATEGLDAGRVIAILLAVRSATVGAGNRRQLFAAMDQVLEGALLDGNDVPIDVPLGTGGCAVRLDRMRLRNWKSFERADLVIPEIGADRTVVVVGGENGFGKSSILEAFAFGLFGRRALSDIGFLVHSTSGRAGQRRTYRHLLERNLHRSGRAKAEAVCSVGLDLSTADGPIAVERKWYFDEAGGLVEDEEELLVRVGPDRSLLEIPLRVSAADWYQEEIERRVLPASLAPFFIFDGEQIERWGERRLSDQVRSALAKMLGLDDLRGLAEDLRAFAKDRERGVGAERGPELPELQSEADRLVREAGADRDLLAQLNATLAVQRGERDALLAEIATLSSGSHSDFQMLLERRHRLEAELQRKERELIALLLEQGPLALSGVKLLHQTASTIEAAMPSELDLLSRESVALIVDRVAAVDPPLSEEAIADLRRRVDAAMTASERPPLDDPHRHLGPTLRRPISERLRRLAATAAGALAAAHISRLRTVDEISARQSAIEESELRSTRHREAQRQLGTLSAAIEEAEGQRGFLRRQIEAVDARLEPLRDELERRTDQVRQAEPRLRLAAIARAMSTTIEEHMSTVADGEHSRFAKAVTKRFRSLSHKGQVQRVEIGRSGEIALFDDRGADITDYRMSAGESQLFAMALIGAVSDIVGDRLPLIVDTPLGRLDTRHRASVLNMLAHRRSQTILLTQPEEVNARHMERLQPALAGALTITHAVDIGTGVGVSRFVAGYEP